MDSLRILSVTYKFTELEIQACIRYIAEYHGAISENPEMLNDLPEMPEGPWKNASLHLGPGLFDICLFRLCLDKNMTYCEYKFGWPPRSGKIVLKIAAQRLVNYYGKDTL